MESNILKINTCMNKVFLLPLFVSFCLVACTNVVRITTPEADAENVIVAMGSVTETAKEAVDYLMAKGEKVGVLTVRLYRPFSSKYFMRVLPESLKSEILNNNYSILLSLVRKSALTCKTLDFLIQFETVVTWLRTENASTTNENR